MNYFKIYFDRSDTTVYIINFWNVFFKPKECVGERPGADYMETSLKGYFFDLTDLSLIR